MAAYGASVVSIGRRGVSVVGVVALAGGLGGCGSPDRDEQGAAPAGPSVVGEGGTTWQWQLTGAIDTSHDVDVYDVDLFEAPASTIDALRADGRLVICYFSAGTLEEWRPDAGDFPPDAVGRPMDGWDGERWLDVRSPEVIVVLERRLDLAVERGCDGVEPDNVVGYDDGTGFDFDLADQLAFDRAIAEAARARGLLVALKNGPELVLELVDSFDLAVTEQCHEFDECEGYLPFVEQGKPVLNAEYADRWVDDAPAREEMCADSARLGISTVVLPLELDGSFRLGC